MSIQLDIEREPTEEFRTILKNTVWGMEGKTRYSHTETDKNINRMVNPWYFYLRWGKRLLGTIVVNHREFEYEGNHTDAYYIRYFTFLQQYQAQKIKKNKTSSSDGLIREKLRNIFESGKINHETKKGFFYSYVEGENERSAQVCYDFGFEPVRKLGTTIFSRFFPKSNAHIRSINTEEQPYIRKRLKEFYSSHNLYVEDQLFKKGQYFVAEKEGRIVAGLQAIPTNWIIRELPGLSGKFLLRILPHLPVFSKIFNPSNHRFLSFDQVFFEEGHESELEGLMETALAKMNHYSGMIWNDSKCPVYQAIINEVNLGIMNKLASVSPSNILIRFSNFDEAEKRKYFDKPAYICAFDLT